MHIQHSDAEKTLEQASDGWISDVDNKDFDGPSEPEDPAIVEARRLTWEAIDSVEQTTNPTPEEEFEAKQPYRPTHEDVYSCIQDTNATLRILVNLGVEVPFDLLEELTAAVSCYIEGVVDTQLGLELISDVDYDLNLVASGKSYQHAWRTTVFDRLEAHLRR